jgi:hypothetical protein
MFIFQLPTKMPAGQFFPALLALYYNYLCKSIVYLNSKDCKYEHYVIDLD